MAVSYDNTGRGIKVLVNGVHMKTIPVLLLESFKNHYNKITFDKKRRITPEERKLLHSYLVYLKWIRKLRKTEKHLYQLIKEAYPVATRKVIALDSERFELVLDNNLKVKCPEKIYLMFTTKPNIIHSNF